MMKHCKKPMTILLALLLAAGFGSGCRDKQDEEIVVKEGIVTKVSEPAETTAETSSTPETIAVTQTELDRERIVNRKDAPAGSEPLDRYTFVYKHVALKPMAAAEPLLKALGEPEEIYESESRLFAGSEKVYIYKGLELNVVNYRNTPVIAAIFVTGPELKTPGGIGLGSTAEEARKVYGEPNTVRAGHLIWQGEQAAVHMVSEHDKITSISFRARFS